MPEPSNPVTVPMGARLIFATFGFAFAAIGITVIGFLWFGDDGFGGPPLFFKLFGSFIAIVFIVMGGTLGVSALTAQPKLPALPSGTMPSTTPTSPTAGAFACPHCGAALTSGTEASPHGDIKCTHCGAWFNIHRRIA